MQGRKFKNAEILIISERFSFPFSYLPAGIGTTGKLSLPSALID
jgi:hypothetical protein